MVKGIERGVIEPNARNAPRMGQTTSFEKYKLFGTRNPSKKDQDNKRKNGNWAPDWL